MNKLLHKPIIVTAYIITTISIYHLFNIIYIMRSGMLYPSNVVTNALSKI